MRALALILPLAALAAALPPHAQRQTDDRARAELSAQGAGPAAEPARLVFSERCVLEAVARHKGRTLDPSKPLPPVLLESATPLARFQDAVEGQWGQRPPMFSNAYSLKTGEIFLIDDASYYRRLGRAIDDSLAHELTHYVQVAYEGADLLHDDAGSYEMDAVDVQTWFRTDVYPAGPGACR